MINETEVYKMALSMTGYGREKVINNGYDICVEIKSVNNR